jgi:cytochrome subunit of sulfide dehydrogenase
MRTYQFRHQWVAALVGISSVMSVCAQSSTRDFQAEVWATSCMACHGTDGKAQGVGVQLAGRTEADLAGQLIAFKSGQRLGTIMQKHAKGYSDDELKRIAKYFASVK